MTKHCAGAGRRSAALHSPSRLSSYVTLNEERRSQLFRS